MEWSVVLLMLLALITLVLLMLKLGIIAGAFAFAGLILTGRFMAAFFRWHG